MERQDIDYIHDNEISESAYNRGFIVGMNNMPIFICQHCKSQIGMRMVFPFIKINYCPFCGKEIGK